MTLTDADYQVVVTGLMKGIECKNTFWYQADNTGSVSGDLYTEFENTLLPSIANILSSDFVFTYLSVINLADIEDFTIGSVSVPGVRPSDSLPVFVGWYMRYFRPTRLIHDGRKTFAGIAENDVLDGVLISSQNTAMATVVADLAGSLDPGNGVLYYPCIAQTVEFTNPTNGKVYRRPDKLWHTAGVAYVKVSTQNSRKR